MRHHFLRRATFHPRDRGVVAFLCVRLAFSVCQLIRGRIKIQVVGQSTKRGERQKSQQWRIIAQRSRRKGGDEDMDASALILRFFFQVSRSISEFREVFPAPSILSRSSFFFPFLSPVYQFLFLRHLRCGIDITRISVRMLHVRRVPPTAALK